MCLLNATDIKNGATALSITTFSITTHNDIQHNNKNNTTLSIMAFNSNDERHYTMCHSCLLSQLSPLWWVLVCWMSLCWMSWRLKNKILFILNWDKQFPLVSMFYRNLTQSHNKLECLIISRFYSWVFYLGHGRTPPERLHFGGRLLHSPTNIT